jgi:hypothetical protein
MPCEIPSTPYNPNALQNPNYGQMIYILGIYSCALKLKLLMSKYSCTSCSNNPKVCIGEFTIFSPL